MIIWNIGPKFLGRNREAALPGTVYFQKDARERPAPYRQKTSTTDAMCVGQTAYVSLHFKILDEGLGKLAIDTQNLTVYPNQKPKVIVSRELEADDYLIWNSLGHARYAYQPESAVSQSEAE